MVLMRTLATVVAAVSLAGAVARAGTVDEDAARARQDADEHARRGLALYRLGRFLEAIGEFEEAYTLNPSDTLLYNIGQAHRRLDHSCEAAIKYRLFLEGSPTSSLAPDVRALLPDLERACEMTERTPLNPSDAPAVATADVPQPEESLPVDEPGSRAATSRFRVAAGLAVSSVASADAAAAPVGIGVGVHRLVLERRFEVGVEIRLGWFGVERGRAVAGLALATVAMTHTRGRLDARAGGGAGLLVLDGIRSSSLLASREWDRSGLTIPVIAAVASVDWQVIPGWSVRGVAALAIGPGMAVLRGGILSDLSLLVGVGYER
jgi:hypothetical protein